jgi:hypothetical protein
MAGINERLGRVLCRTWVRTGLIFLQIPMDQERELIRKTVEVERVCQDLLQNVKCGGKQGLIIDDSLWVEGESHRPRFACPTASALVTTGELEPEETRFKLRVTPAA